MGSALYYKFGYANQRDRMTAFYNVRERKKKEGGERDRETERQRDRETESQRD